LKISTETDLQTGYGHLLYTPDRPEPTALHDDVKSSLGKIARLTVLLAPLPLASRLHP